MTRSLRNRRRSSRFTDTIARQTEVAEARTLLAAAIDGTGNNIDNPELGSTNESFQRLADADYADDISAVGGETRPSARVISNAVADSGGEDRISDRLMAAMMYVWGQFIDHDMTLTASDRTEPMSIPVPTGDPSFDPTGTGTATINTFRSAFDPLAGTDTSNPREQINQLSAFLDGSMIYGSDAETAASLRTFSGGHLKTSDGNLLPAENGSFLAGDIRVNENIELTALHTLFMREHNLQADKVAAANPSLTDEEIYQQARAIVIAEVQAITFNEWLPALLGQNAIAEYDGYDSSVNPEITNEFATAAFRFGHSLLGDDVEFLDNNGLATRDEVSLAEAFFNPSLVTENGIDGILKYLVSDPSSELDTEVVDSVRNFLFGAPGAGGLDLASLNIQRGRDHGLADYNTVREAIGLPRVTSFADITSDTELQAELNSLYGSVDNIDLWVGGLAEDHLPGSSMGETFTAILKDQFQRLRDGDRYWYQNQFSGEQLSEIAATSLADVIERNTTLTSVQNNAFFFKAAISGIVRQDINRDGKATPKEPVAAGAKVQLINTEDQSVVATTTTDRSGQYSFEVNDGLRTGVYKVQVMRADGTVAASSGTVSITGGDDFEKVDVAIAVPKPAKPSRPMPPPRGSKGHDSVRPPIAAVTPTKPVAPPSTANKPAAVSTTTTATAAASSDASTTITADVTRSKVRRQAATAASLASTDSSTSESQRRTGRHRTADLAVPPQLIDELFATTMGEML